jgi:hypothetical protein
MLMASTSIMMPSKATSQENIIQSRAFPAQKINSHQYQAKRYQCSIKNNQEQSLSKKSTSILHQRPKDKICHQSTESINIQKRYQSIIQFL